MTPSNLKSFFIGVLAAVLLIAGSWPVWADLGLGQTGPIQTGDVSAFDGGDSILVVPGAAFQSDGFLPTSVFFTFGGGYFQGDSENYGCMVAPVYLPAGVPVRRMMVSVFDNDPTRSASIQLRRVHNFAGGTDTMASVSTTAAGANVGIEVLGDETINFPLITAPDYSYYLTTCLGSSNIRLYSVRIYYGFDTYLPIIRRN